MGFALSKMQLTSTAFKPGGAIPVCHTGEGEDLSPPLSWRGAPEATRQFVLFCHDADAPLVSAGRHGFVHWVLYNIPRTTTDLEQNTRLGTPGVTDFDHAGYGGPMPPPGHGIHRYFFWVLALDRDLPLERGLALEQLLGKIEPQLLGMNRLMGTYERR